MTQTLYADPSALAGALGTYLPADIISVLNPNRQQVTQYDQDAATDDGTYTLQAVDATGYTVSASFVASSLTAAQIAAGLVAAINDDPDFAGVASAATTASEIFAIMFTRAGWAWTVTLTSDPSTGVADITTPTAAGYTEINPGVILQGDGAGGFTTAYTDAALALGVVTRNADLVVPMDVPSTATGYTGPAMLGLLRRGEIFVTVSSGVVILAGQKAYFNGTAKTWSNATTGSHVLVEGAQWRTSGTGGVQRVFVQLPSET